MKFYEYFAKFSFFVIHHFSLIVSQSTMIIFKFPWNNNIQFSYIFELNRQISLPIGKVSAKQSCDIIYSIKTFVPTGLNWNSLSPTMFTKSLFSQNTVSNALGCNILLRIGKLRNSISARTRRKELDKPKIIFFFFRN